MTTRWTIGIDWDRDGSYTDETDRVLSAKWSLGFQQAYMDVGNDAQLRLFPPALTDESEMREQIYYDRFAD